MRCGALADLRDAHPRGATGRIVDERNSQLPAHSGLKARPRKPLTIILSERTARRFVEGCPTNAYNLPTAFSGRRRASGHIALEPSSASPTYERKLRS